MFVHQKQLYVIELFKSRWQCWLLVEIIAYQRI